MSETEPSWIGTSNPADEQPEAKEPEEYIMGRYMTKESLIDTLNKDSRVVFVVDEHYDGELYIKVKFAE